MINQSIEFSNGEVIPATKEPRHISPKEIAQLIRADLKAKWPVFYKAKGFSVRSDRNSVSVEWVDGPTRDEVSKIARAYEGSTFESMSDLKMPNGPELVVGENGIEEVKYDADYVFCRREISRERTEQIAQQISKDWGLPVPALTVNASGAFWYPTEFVGAWGIGSWNDMVHQYSQTIDYTQAQSA